MEPTSETQSYWSGNEPLIKTAQTQIHVGAEACVRSSEVISTIDLNGRPLRKP